MKKKYMKPEIMFEDFSLNTSIAANCEGIVDNATKGICAVIGTGGIKMFSSSISDCDFYPSNDENGKYSDEWDGFCYHVPTEYNNLFNS